MIVKVCGVRTADIADAAIAAGADWIGVVFEPRSPRHASPAEAWAVAEAVRGRATLVAVTVAPSVWRCGALVEQFGVEAVQAHGFVARELASDSPVPVIPAINVSMGSEALFERWWPDCLVLIDAGAVTDDALPGGTGRRVDPATAAAMARHRPVILAGGLGPGNVAAAIETVRPRGVDASSGLESSPGVKDRDLVMAFVSAARAALDRSPAARG